MIKNIKYLKFYPIMKNFKENKSKKISFMRVAHLISENICFTIIWLLQTIKRIKYTLYNICITTQANE